MSGVAHDVRCALRSFAKRPGFTLVVVATLAIGIGATTAIFSVVNAVMLRPLPFVDPDRLVMIRGTDAKRGHEETHVSYPDFRDWREASSSFEDLAALWSFPNGDVNLTGGVEPERVPVARVTAGFFEILGVRFEYGRGFLPEENVLGSHRVAVISHRLWQRLYGGDAALVGQPVHVNGFPYTVVGILPAGFRPLGVLAPDERVELWRPLAPDDNQTGGRETRNLRVLGRLRPGATLEGAAGELQAIARRIGLAFPETNEGRSVTVVPLREQVVEGTRPALFLLIGAVFVVLVIAGTNVASMLLARGGARRHELSIRRALGASRLRIVRHLLVESTVLGAIGGIAGVALAFGGVRLLGALGPSGLPRLQEIGIDSRVLGFALITSIGAGLLFGLVPAFHGSAQAPGDGLRSGARGHAGGLGHGLRQVLVLAELTLTLVLLIGAGLLIRSFGELMDADPGFKPERLLTLQLELPMGTKYPEQWQRTAIFDELLDRIERLPQVSAATMVTAPPLGEGAFTTTFAVEGETIDPATAPAASIQLVGRDYFRTLEIPLLEGRDFDERDDTDSPAVAIVNETAARRWPGGRALHGRFSIGGGDATEVVGVVRDVRTGGLDEAVPPSIYLPSGQRAYNFMTLVLRTEATPRDVLPAVRAIVRAIDPEQPVYNVRTMDELIARSVAHRRYPMMLLAGFSGMALLLSLVGVYGVMSCIVGQRTREIGVRIALGARPREVARIIVGEAAGLALLATAFGVPIALALTRLLSASLFGIRATDPWTWLPTIAILVGTAVLGAFLPARRAAAADPTLALRTD